MDSLATELIKELKALTKRLFALLVIVTVDKAYKISRKVKKKY